MRLLGLLAFGVLLAAASTSVMAQPAQPHIEARQVGWQPSVPLVAGGWNPFVARVVGGGSAEATARVQVLLAASNPNSPQTNVLPLAAYAQDVALPPGVSKDVKIWVAVPGGEDQTLVATVQLLGSTGQVLDEQSVTARSSRGDVPVIATLADSATLAAQLARIEVPYQQGLTAQVRGVELTAADLPANAQYLSAFSALVSQGNASAALTHEQRRAIQEWVTLGGRLLIAGGPDGSRAASVLDTPSRLPMRFSGLDAAIDLQPLATWISTDTSAAPGSAPASRIDASPAEVLVGQPDKPLASRARLGDGSVTLLAADPSLEPLRAWSGTPALLKRALDLPLQSGPTNQKAVYDSLDSETRLLGALDALPPQAFPDWQHVGLLLGAFALVAGPLLHVLLWRIDRRPWLWVAVPVLSLMFTGAIYFIAGLQPGRDVVVNAISDVRLEPATGEARQTLAVAFFAPLRDHLTVRASGEVPMRPFLGTTSVPSASLMMGGGASSSVVGFASGTSGRLAPYRVVSGRDTEVEFLSNPTAQGAQRSVVLRRTLPASTGRIEADLHLEGSDGIIRGSIRNATPYEFEQVGIAIDRTLFKIGPLIPGQTAAVSIDPRAAPPKSGEVPYSFGWQMFGAASSTGRGPVTGTISAMLLPDDPDVRRRVRVMEAVLGDPYRFSQYGYSYVSLPSRAGAGMQSQFLTSTGPVVLALSSASIGADMLPTSGAERAFQLNVLQQRVQIGVATGPFTIPPALLPPAVSADAGATLSSAGYAGGGPGWYELRGGTATYDFSANLPTGARVDTLRIRTQQTPPAAQSSPAGAPLGPATPSLIGPGAPGPGLEGTFSIFDWQAGSWVPIGNGQMQTTLAPAELFVGPNAAVRIRVNSGGPNRSLRFLPPELTMQGEAPA